MPRSPGLPSGEGTEECCRGQPLSARISQRRTWRCAAKRLRNAVMKLMAWSAVAPAPPGWLRRGQRLPLGDNPDAAPRLGVVGDQRKAAAQLGHGGQFAALLQGVADGCGGRLVDGKHVVSMGPPRAMSKSRERAIIAVELGWRSVAALARSRLRPACGACGRRHPAVAARRRPGVHWARRGSRRIPRRGPTTHRGRRGISAAAPVPDSSARRRACAPAVRTKSARHAGRAGTSCRPAAGASRAAAWPRWRLLAAKG
jgi:hypothetical protein